MWFKLAIFLIVLSFCTTLLESMDCYHLPTHHPPPPLPPPPTHTYVPLVPLFLPVSLCLVFNYFIILYCFTRIYGLLPSTITSHPHPQHTPMYHLSPFFLPISLCLVFNCFIILYSLTRFHGQFNLYSF